jgi:protein-S-isoprenylcysteine O-methyltransferase Ste14
MYVAVLSAILAQGLLFGNVRVVEYGALVWLLFHIFVLIYEEPTLQASFGSEYESFGPESGGGFRASRRGPDNYLAIPRFS